MTASTAPSLHDAIADMLPREAFIGVPMGWSPAYLVGHRDARHAAAELALAADAEIAELREALRDMLSGWVYIRRAHGDLYGVGWDRAQDKAEKALALSATPEVNP